MSALIQVPGAEALGVNSNDRPAWLEARRSLIGASEAAAILGEHPYLSGLDVYLEKAEGLEAEGGAEYLHWGLIFEEPILTEYGRRRGLPVRRFGELIRSRSKPFMGSTIDGLQIDPDRARLLGSPGDFEHVDPDALGITEIKMTSFAWDPEDLPVYIQIQVQAQLFVAGLERATIVWLPFPSRQLQWVDVAAHPSFQGLLVEACELFWRRVEAKDPPPPDGSPHAMRAVQRLYAQDDGSEIELSEEVLTKVDRWQALAFEHREAKKAEQAIKAEILHALGNASLGRLPDGRAVSGKTINRSAYTCEECGHKKMARSFRDLRLKGGKR